VPITADAVKAVEQAVSLSKLTYAGVDAMEVDGKYYVLEVNDSPDLEMFDSEGVNASSACRVAMEQKLRKVKNEF
jgi:glutathione synthase/RimK-type ligase-like ATP-grasp enzyme